MAAEPDAGIDTMNGTSFFSDMLQTISERGRRFLSFSTKTETTPAEKLRDLERACQTLLSSGAKHPEWHSRPQF